MANRIDFHTMKTTRCILALVLVLCSTSLAVGGRPQGKDPNAILHSRRLAAATSAPPIEFSPTWALPSIDPMQMARDLGHGLAEATKSLGARLMAGLAGQASPPVPSTQSVQLEASEAGQSLGRRSAPAPAPTPALATAFGPATASQEAGISLIATAPQAAPAPSVSEGPARAPAPAPAAAHQAAAIQMPATAFAPVAASQAASISTTPAPASASQEAINTTSVTSLEANQTTRELYDTQVDQLADMLSAVFMAHSASQLDIFDHLNTSHAITAAELAVDLFWHQVEGYINGTFNLVKNLPEEIAGLPKNVSDAVASQQQDLSQANNATYLMESFHKLVHDLEEPVGVSGGGSVFSYSPCFVNTSPAGINIDATGINVGAPLVGISPTGISINPTALNIQPTLISVSPTGVNVSPQGLNIAPALIAVAPGRVSVNPQGANIGGALLSVSASP